ncbi:MAG: class I SAM-dependent methyltransferase [Verrucomicrobiia bacterium]
MKGLLFPLRLARLGISNPHGLREVLGVADHLCDYFFDREADVSTLPLVRLTDLAEEEIGIGASVVLMPALRFSITPIEALTLAVLVRTVRARRIFEFGTHRGVSTTQLAANLEEGGEVLTLDLPLDFGEHALGVDNEAEVEVAQFRNKGEMIPSELRSRITFLAEDSAKFDPSPYAGQMDLVFVDAAHTFDYVRNDSEKGWAMLRVGGIIVWHDCRPQSPDVVKYLKQCPYLVKRIEGTTLAFAVKPGGPGLTD